MWYIVIGMNHGVNENAGMHETVLYVHGFNGSPSGHTAQAVQNFFGAEHVSGIQLDLLDYEGTLSALAAAVKERGITLIAAHSFGAFYALSQHLPFKGADPQTVQNVRTVLINPCMHPSEEITKLDPSLSDAWKKEFEEHENRLLGYFPKLSSFRTYGIFADGDELFSYKDRFDKIYGASFGGVHNSCMVCGAHRIPETELHKGLAAAMAFFCRV